MRCRWLMLALGTGAQTAACAFVYGVPYLAAALRDTAHLTLPQIGLLIACPTAGLVAALVAWGAAADRYGERVVIAAGLGGAAALLAVAVSPVVAGAGRRRWARCSPLPEPRVPRCTPRADASSWAGSPPVSGGWPWASGRPPPRSAWAWPR